MRYALHPRNTEFTWRHSEPPYRRLGVDDVRAYGDNGFIAVRDAFTPAEMAAVIAAIDPLEAQTEAFLRSRDGGTLGIARAGEITFRPHLVTQSDRCARSRGIRCCSIYATT